LHHFGVCCKSLGGQVLLKMFEEIEMTGLNTANSTCDMIRQYVWEVTYNAP